MEILGLFTDEQQANQLASLCHGAMVEEWQTNLPAECWITHGAQLTGKLVDGHWDILIQPHSYGHASAVDPRCELRFGRFDKGWTDLPVNQATHVNGDSTGTSEQDAVRRLDEAFKAAFR